jgi:hypothetical protein
LTTPLQTAVKTATPKIQNGLWYSFRSALVWLGAVAGISVLQPLLTSIGACQANHVIFFRCTFDWNNLGYAVELGVLAASIRFVQGFLAHRPPQIGG